MNVKKVRELYEKNKKKIINTMKQHRGAEEYQISFFKDRVDINVHATPCNTVYETEDPLFEMKIQHDPFRGYEKLDEEFEHELEEQIEFGKIQEKEGA